ARRRQERRQHQERGSDQRRPPQPHPDRLQRLVAALLVTLCRAGPAIGGVPKALPSAPTRGGDPGMSAEMPAGYAGRVMHVDLTTGRIDVEQLDGATLRRWIGGTGLGTKYLLELVPPGMEWDDTANPVIIAA